MFLLPDGDKWLDPRTGKHAELAGMSCDPFHECLQVTETGYKKHPLPKAVHLGSGAKRGQLTAEDFRALKANGVDSQKVFDINGKFMMEELGRNK